MLHRPLEKKYLIFTILFFFKTLKNSSRVRYGVRYQDYRNGNFPGSSIQMSFSQILRQQLCNGWSSLAPCSGTFNV